MAQAPVLLEVDEDTTVLVQLNTASVDLSDEQFKRLCMDNPELRFELSADRELIIMSPTSLRTGRRNSNLTAQLEHWSETDGTGYTFDSSTMFTLPNGAKRMPDAAWMRRDRYDALSPEEQDEFSHICPDFVVELRSKSDSVQRLQAKMHEYITNGAQLGWLLDPIARRVYVYRPQTPVAVIDNPTQVAGEHVLPGFVLDLRLIFDR